MARNLYAFKLDDSACRFLAWAFGIHMQSHNTLLPGLADQSGEVNRKYSYDPERQIAGLRRTIGLEVTT